MFRRCTPAGVRPKPYADNKSRYLWTDAHGVLNYIALAHETRDESFLWSADALIDDVHSTLGRSRDGRAVLGRPGAPLCNGLRIGKAAAEGAPDGDGQ